MADPHRPSEEDILQALAQRASTPTSDAGACPDADMLAAFLTGGLVAQERTQLEHHLSRCARCLPAIADLATDDDLVEEPAGRPRPATHALPDASRARWIFAAAAALLMAFGAWWLSMPPRPDAPRSLADSSAALRAANPEALADLVPLTTEELNHPPTPTERGGIRLFTPVGVEFNTQPTFRFATQPGVASYQVRVLTDAGDVVWTSTTSASEFPYPDDKPALQAGRNYLWEVAFERLGKQMARTSFTLASRESAMEFLAARAVIEAGAPKAQQLLLSAHMAIRRSYWSEARRLAKQALEARPAGDIEKATYLYVLRALGE